MIAIVGGKGGCGKTTTTACLARALAARRTDPIVVDADRDMPDLHHVAGGHRSPGLDALADGAAVDGVVQSSARLPGVGLVAAGSRGRVAPLDALERLSNRDELVLVDTPAGASAAVAKPLRVADAAVVVSAPTTRSLTDAAKSAAMARALDTRVLGSILTRSDGSVDARPLLKTVTLARVPAAVDPLDDKHVREAYAVAAREIHKRNI